MQSLCKQLTAWNYGILSVAQDALHLGFGGVLDGLLDLVHRGTLSQTASQVDNRNIWGGDTESHTSEFAVQVWDDLKNISIEVVNCWKSTFPTALAAPVEAGMIFWPAPRPSLHALAEGPSTVFWVAV